MFNANGYTQHEKSETAAAAEKRARIASIEKRTKVLVYNSATRRDEWHTVEAVSNRSDLTTAQIVTTKGNKLWASEVKVAVQPERTETLMICLNDRQSEFREVLKRAGASDLQIFHDFEFDAFVVVNPVTRHEYQVNLKAVGSKALASCSCADFKHRNRVCKHISIILRDFVCSIMSKFASAEIIEV